MKRRSISRILMVLFSLAMSAEYVRLSNLMENWDIELYRQYYDPALTYDFVEKPKNLWSLSITLIRNCPHLFDLDPGVFPPEPPEIDELKKILLQDEEIRKVVEEQSPVSSSAYRQFLRLDSHNLLRSETPYDENNLSIYKPIWRFALTFRFETPEKYSGDVWFNTLEELPSGLQKAISFFLNDILEFAVHKLESKHKAELNRFPCRDPMEILSEAVQRIESAISTEKNPERLEFLRRYLPSVKYELAIMPRIQQFFGKTTEREKRRVLAYRQYHETRCARMILENRAEEAKKDFECRNIQVQDYLRYGVQGAPPEILQQRAVKELPPVAPSIYQIFHPRWKILKHLMEWWNAGKVPPVE